MPVDPLDQLFTKNEQVEGEQRALLAKMVFPFATIDPERGSVYFKPTADDLPAKHKVLVYLLCRLALSTRPNSAFTATASPKEIESATHLPGGTVRPKLAQLVNDRVVEKSGDGYIVPPHRLHHAHKQLEPQINEAQ